MHTDSTLGIMERLTVHLAQQMRKFTSETCPSFVTKELPRETESRRRREAQGGPAKTVHSPAPNVRRLKTLNLQTYKVHALGDYHNQIRMFGTTDSFSTQSVSFHYVVLRSLNDQTGRESSSTVSAKIGLPERVEKYLSRNWHPLNAARNEFAVSELR